VPQPDQELRQYPSQTRFFDEKTDQRHQEIPSTSALVDFIKRMLLSSRVKQTLRYDYAPTLKNKFHPKRSSNKHEIKQQRQFFQTIKLSQDTYEEWRTKEYHQ